MSIFDIFAKLEQAHPKQPISHLIVGLGNPGEQYQKTRHNAGFRAIDAFCLAHGCKVNKIRFHALVGEVTLGGHRVLLMKPQTYMNLSGEAVKEATDFYKIPPERIVVLFDDISLPVGRIRVRGKGSAGGQNGVKNIIAQLGTDAFPRVKIGVGDKPHPEYDLAKWVLSRMSEGEEKAFAPALVRAMEAAECILTQGAQQAAQRYNGKIE